MMYGWRGIAVQGDIDYPLSKEANDIITQSYFENKVIEIDNPKIFAELEIVCGICYKLNDSLVAVGGIWKGKEWGISWKVF